MNSYVHRYNGYEMERCDEGHVILKPLQHTLRCNDMCIKIFTFLRRKKLCLDLTLTYN